MWYRSGDAGRRTCFNFQVKILWWAVANPRATSPFSKKHFTEVSISFPILAQLAQSETAAVNKLHVQFVFRYLKSTFTGAMATYTGYGDGNSDNLFGIYLELESEGSAPNSKFFPGQDLMECVLHVRCISHHNSLRQVWASVWWVWYILIFCVFAIIPSNIVIIIMYYYFWFLLSAPPYSCVYLHTLS